MTSLSIRLEARSAVHRCYRAYVIDVGTDLFGAWLVDMSAAIAPTCTVVAPSKAMMTWLLILRSPGAVRWRAMLTSSKTTRMPMAAKVKPFAQRKAGTTRFAIHSRKPASCSVTRSATDSPSRDASRSRLTMTPAA